MEFTFSTASKKTVAYLQAKLDAEAAAVEGFHGQINLTGRVFNDTTDGTTWFEIVQPDANGETAWVSWDAPLDPRAPLAATPTAITGWADTDALLDPTRF